MTHEPIKNGLFCKSYYGGTGTFSAWEGVMLNVKEVASLLVERMNHDYASTSPKFRRAFTTKDIDPRTCLLHSLVLNDISMNPSVCSNHLYSKLSSGLRTASLRKICSELAPHFWQQWRPSSPKCQRTTSSRNSQDYARRNSDLRFARLLSIFRSCPFPGSFPSTWIPIWPAWLKEPCRLSNSTALENFDLQSSNTNARLGSS